MVDEGAWCDCEHEFIVFITEVCNQFSGDGLFHVLQACLHEVVLVGEWFKLLIMQCLLAVELSVGPIANGEHAWVGWCWMLWHCWDIPVGVGCHKSINGFLLSGCPLFLCHEDPCPASVFCAWVDAGEAAKVGFDCFLEFLDL